MVEAMVALLCDHLLRHRSCCEGAIALSCGTGKMPIPILWGSVSSRFRFWPRSLEWHLQPASGWRWLLRNAIAPLTNMDNEFQSRVEQFSALSPSTKQPSMKIHSLSLLYLILRKLDLEIELTEFEFNWLLEHELLKLLKLSSRRSNVKKRKLLNSKFNFSSSFLSIKHFNIVVQSIN